ncbi:Uncharacterised protein [Bacillus freudenreichii]|nr:Uncharacterised protein [Bacillus freudenreichii]
MTEEQFWTEFNGIKQELMDKAEENAKTFWTREDLTHEEVFNSIIPRDWHEIAYVSFIGTLLQKYWREYDRNLVTALCKHLWDEANHYEIISRVLENHGYEPPTDVPEPSQAWEDLHWEALEKDSTCAIAVWNVSETSTTPQMDIVIENCRRIGLDDLARVYEKIKKDEDFHCKLGVNLLERHMKTEEQRKNAIWGARKLRDHMFKLYDSIYAIETVQG